MSEQQQQQDHRCGFVAVVGRPNVGKSTLINRIVGRKVSIVTPRPQTTRHRIHGITEREGAQIIFVDTPGLHGNQPRAINRAMNRAATGAAAEADLLLFMFDARGWRGADQMVLDRIRDSGHPVIAIANKADLVRPKERLLETLARVADKAEFAEIVPLSARTGDNVDRLLALIPRYLPVSPALYDRDTVTDRSESFMAAELIREKLMLRLRDELPYGLTVVIEKFDRSRTGYEIDAVVYVDKPSHKGIVVGRGGGVLKAVGTSARRELKRMLGAPVHLELWVKVRENWADSEKSLREFGYETR
ncbi:MAG TPA: GTPase Era [Woeseiaceae bacterium]|nr:GTPase Era [Woeseiaceae bacterium]